jgi:23S rRNA pseudouridine1911/1915/1917 synthase
MKLSDFNEIEVPILYEDESCIFIHKPAGLNVHGDGKTREYTLADWILEYHPTLAAVGEHMQIQFKGETLEIPKPGIVHRLDKETSGVMLLAKTHEAYLFFKKQFQEREIRKVYHCFVYGWMKEDTMSIDAAIGRDSGSIRRYTTGGTARGMIREASTEVSVLGRLGALPDGRTYDGKGSTEEGTYSFVEARPRTGRTHQIRVHLRSVNHPIVADSLYAGKRDPALGFTRLALHARELTVVLPSGESKTVQAPYPPDFEKALRNMA